MMRLCGWLNIAGTGLLVLCSPEPLGTVQWRCSALSPNHSLVRLRWPGSPGGRRWYNGALDQRRRLSHLVDTIGIAGRLRH